MVLSHITSLPSLPFLECLVSSNQSHLGKSCRFHQFEHFFFQRSPSLTFFCRILCMIGSQVISSLLSLALMFMGFLGISDLRNPNQWYCSDGDKNRMIHWITKTSHSKIVLFYNLGNHAVSYALFALLVIVGFVHICVTVISILLSCYTAFCATKSYPGIVCNCNNPSLNDQPNIWRSEATEVTDPIRPPGNFTITYSLITHHFFML